MKIAYNPKTAAVITTATAANDDILFDLNAKKVWAKGLRMGADWADISSKPSSLKNPYALTISLNGTSQGPYDGSAAKSINITPSSIGAATSGHNHDGRYVYNYGASQMDGASKNKNALGMSTTSGISGDWWHILQAAWNDEYRWNSQIAFPTLNRNGMYYRSGLDDNTAWGDWVKLLDIGNSYVKDGKGVINGATITQVDNATNASVASKVYGQVGDTGSHELVRCDMNNDQFRIIAGSNGNNNGWAEIATADDGSEPIYVRQYTGEFSSIKRTLTLLDANGYTHFPSYINIGGNENNNSSPDRVWGSNSSDSYLRSYRTSALRVAYAVNANSATTASSANKLTTARNIALGTDLRGSANFDGSSNITISANINACTVQVHGTNGLPFKRIAHFETESSWNDNALLLYISLGYIDGNNGICRVEFRTNNISSSSTSDTAFAAVRWLVRNGYGLDSLYAGYYATTGKAYIDIYLKTTGGHQGTVIRVLLDSRGSINSNVLLINAKYVSDTDHKEAYSSIEDASQALYNRAYTRIVSGSDAGTVNYANSTGSANSATKLQTARTIWGQRFDGTANVDNTLRIRQTTGYYCEGIRIQTGDGTWATIILGATADSGTNANAWSIHRKADNNFAISRNSSDGTNGLVMTSVGMGLGTTTPTHRLDVRGDAKITGSIRDLTIGGGIYWDPHAESAGDSSDAASITVVRAGVAGGTTLVLSLMNDANDTILFKTNGAARLYHNNNFILTSKDTKVTSGKGYIDNTEITQVNNADTVDGKHASDFAPASHKHDDIYIKKVGDIPVYNDIIISPSNLQEEGIDGGGGIHVKGFTGTSFLLWLHDTGNVWYKKTRDGAWKKMDAGHADTAGSVAWNNVTGKPSSFTPSAHTHAWNSLTHSSTIENQAILTNGEANGWKLLTLNIANWDTAYNLRHSHANKSVLDGITSGLVTNWNTAYNFVSTITGEDADNVINKWDEIVNFLAGIIEDNKLNTLLNSKLSILLLSSKDILTTKTNNALFWVNTIGTAGSITTGPFTDHPYALLSVTNFSQNDTNGKFFYRSRLAFSSAGDIKVASCHHVNEYKLDEAWYNVLTSKNSGIDGSTIKLNGTSITVYSSSTADGRYVKKSGDTMTGALNFANNIWNNVGDDVAIGDHNIAGCLGIKGLNANPGLAFYNSSNTLLSKLVGTSNLFLRISGDNAYNILDNSTTHINNNTITINGTSLTVSKSDHNHDDKYLKWLGNAGQSNMNAIGRISHSSGMTNLSDPGNTIDNPMEGGSKSTFWHLYWQTNYTDNPSGSNAWVALIVNRAGTDRWWVRSRSGGTITNGTDWNSNWRFLVTAPTSGLGSANLPIYVNSAGEVIAANSYPTSLKSPHSLTLKANGTVLATYDGSSAKEANFTYANVGAASANHNHDTNYVRRWDGFYGIANKFLKLTISDEKGWIRLEVSDSNNGLTGGYGIYMIGWGWHGENNTDNLYVRCLYANNVDYIQALKVVRTSRNNYDIYFQFKNHASQPAYTVNYCNLSVQSLDYTVIAVSEIPTATWTSSLAALQLNASQVNWSGITNKPSEFNPAAHTHTVFKNNLMIKGTNGMSDSASIHLGIGDSDTGFKWISDGKCLIYANNVAVGEWTSGGMNWFKNPTVNGNKVWNAGNDGPDSGLDADTVDGYHATSGRTFNGNINWSENWNDAWSDGTHTHPWYGFDHRYGMTGVYSTTLSDYFGLTLKTGSGNISMTNSGNVGIGLFDPIYKLLVAGNVYASDKITSAGFKHSGVTKNSDLYVLTADGGYTFLNLTSNELAHEFDVDITVTSEWLDIEDFYGDNLNFLTLPGTYIVLVYYTTNSANSMYEGYFSGIMSWYTGTTNSNNADEIVLHRVGHAYANTIYLRTRESLRDDPHPYTKLQISANSDLKQHTYKFKFKRIC